MRSRHVKKFRWRAEEKLVNSGEDICVRPTERMQDPAANTAPGYCDDDEVCGEEGGSHRSRATTSLQSWRPPKALPTIRLANKNPKTQTSITTTTTTTKTSKKMSTNSLKPLLLHLRSSPHDGQQQYEAAPSHSVKSQYSNTAQNTRADTDSMDVAAS